MKHNQTETLHIDFPDISNGINLNYTVVGNTNIKIAVFKVHEQNTNTEVSNASIKLTNDIITDIKINFIGALSSSYTNAIYNTILTICNES